MDKAFTCYDYFYKNEELEMSQILNLRYSLNKNFDIEETAKEKDFLLATFGSDAKDFAPSHEYKSCKDIREKHGLVSLCKTCPYDKKYANGNEENELKALYAIISGEVRASDVKLKFNTLFRHELITKKYDGRTCKFVGKNAIPLYNYIYQAALQGFKKERLADETLVRIAKAFELDDESQTRIKNKINSVVHESGNHVHRDNIKNFMDEANNITGHSPKQKGKDTEKSKSSNSTVAITPKTLNFFIGDMINNSNDIKANSDKKTDAQKMTPRQKSKDNQEGKQNINIKTESDDVNSNFSNLNISSISHTEKIINEIEKEILASRNLAIEVINDDLYVLPAATKELYKISDSDLDRIISLLKIKRITVLTFNTISLASKISDPKVIKNVKAVIAARMVKFEYETDRTKVDALAYYARVDKEELQKSLKEQLISYIACYNALTKKNLSYIECKEVEEVNQYLSLATLLKVELDNISKDIIKLDPFGEATIKNERMDELKGKRINVSINNEEISPKTCKRIFIKVLGNVLAKNQHNKLNIVGFKLEEKTIEVVADTIVGQRDLFDIFNIGVSNSINEITDLNAKLLIKIS